MHATTGFVLHGGDIDFANRQKLLFDQLSVAEKEYNKNKCSNATVNNADAEENDMDVEDENDLRSHIKGIKRKRETKRFRGKESIFKRPDGPAPRAINRSIPDYHRNPHKWVKYTLEDVSKEDMSDKSNAQAAFSFLRELKARKSANEPEEEENMDIDMSEKSDKKDEVKFKSRKIKSNTKVEFRKLQAEEGESSKVVIDNNDKPVFRSSKIIMPEYVVGQKPQKKDRKKKKPVKIDRSKELKLDHLMEPDDSDET